MGFAVVSSWGSVQGESHSLGTGTVAGAWGILVGVSAWLAGAAVVSVGLHHASSRLTALGGVLLGSLAALWLTSAPANLLLVTLLGVAVIISSGPVVTLVTDVGEGLSGGTVARAKLGGWGLLGGRSTGVHLLAVHLAASVLGSLPHVSGASWALASSLGWVLGGNVFGASLQLSAHGLLHAEVSGILSQVGEDRVVSLSTAAEVLVQFNGSHVLLDGLVHVGSSPVGRLLGWDVLGSSASEVGLWLLSWLLSGAVVRV